MVFLESNFVEVAHLSTKAILNSCPKLEIFFWRKSLRKKTLLKFCSINLIVSLLLLSCTGENPPRSATLQPESSRSTPTIEATRPASPTANPCPAYRTIPDPERPSNFQDYSSTLAQYLSAGGEPQTLPQLLQSWEALPPEPQAPLSADLTGDGVPEIIQAWIDPTSAAYPPDGAMGIFTCREGKIVALSTEIPGDWFFINPIGAVDMDGNGQLDMIFSEITCGAHTCWHNPHVWTWQEAEFVDLIRGDLSYPYPIFTLQENQLQVVSHGIGSVGAGPQRTITVTLGWTGNEVTITQRLTGPPHYRYHAFSDGELAWNAGNMTEAEALYRQVIDDPALESWRPAPDDIGEQEGLRALARWRMVLLSLQIENYIQAQDQYDTLQLNAPTGTPAVAMAAFSRTFWETYLKTNDINQGCQAALTLPEAENVVEFLNLFGYANRVYEVKDLCPFPKP